MLALLLSFAGILYLWNQAGSFNILSFHWGWVLITFLSFLLLWFCDSSALRSILQSQGIKVPILLLFKLTLSGFFFGAITPFQIGNIPALTVLLEKTMFLSKPVSLLFCLKVQLMEFFDPLSL